jgi:hypothetical protein
VAAKVLLTEVPRIQSLEIAHARIVCKARMQLVMADIDRKHMRGTALDQHLGEPAGRGADIERHPA